MHATNINAKSTGDTQRTRRFIQTKSEVIALLPEKASRVE